MFFGLLFLSSILTASDASNITTLTTIEEQLKPEELMQFTPQQLEEFKQFMNGHPIKELRTWFKPNEILTPTHVDAFKKRCQEWQRQSKTQSRDLEKLTYELKRLNENLKEWNEIFAKELHKEEFDPIPEPTNIMRKRSGNRNFED